MESWFTVRELAKIKNCATSNIYKKIKDKKLAVKKVGKITYVSEDLSLQPAEKEEEFIEVKEPLTLEQQKNKISNELLKARIKKLEKETEYQEQKLDAIKENMMIDFTGAIIQAYSEAYAKFKNDLISLRLQEKQLANLQDLFARCTKNFISKIKGLQKNDQADS